MLWHCGNMLRGEKVFSSLKLFWECADGKRSIPENLGERRCLALTAMGKVHLSFTNKQRKGSWDFHGSNKNRLGPPLRSSC